MARHVVLGNGNLLVGLSADGIVRDVYYDRVGLENQTGGHPQRVGIFVDGELSWVEQYDWIVETNYLEETLVGEVFAKNDRLQLEIYFEDFVYNEEDVFVRRVKVKNLSDRKRDIKLFFHNDLEVGGYTWGVTAFYYPRYKSLVHHRGSRIFLFSGQFNGENLSAHSIGMTRYNGLEGTWKDAEDGNLTGNSIEHGRVDSVMEFESSIGPGRSTEGYYWMTAADTMEGVIQLHESILERTPFALYESTRDYWRAWVNKQNFSFYGLTPEQVRLFKTSLLVMRVHTDNRGSVIASSDSDMLQQGKDTYAYMWPRDGAYIAMAYSKAGYEELSKTFFQFCLDLITEDGYFMHKYLPDGSYGSSWHAWIEHGRDILPIQEDETAIMLHALWIHYERTRDIEFIESIYNSFIKKAANFLASYRHIETDLPLHSYDLWEENHGVSTYTAASVVGGLRAAGNFAKLLSKKHDEELFTSACKLVQKALKKHLIDTKNHRLMKTLKYDEFGELKQDWRIDTSSLLGIVEFDVLDNNDPFLHECATMCTGELWNESPVGGICRYSDDQYYRVDPQFSNPWIITTLWRAKYLIKTAKKKEDMKEVEEIFQWVADRALPSGVLPEQVHPHSGVALSATPLVWSHAEYVTAVVDYLNKLESFGVCTAKNPI